MMGLRDLLADRGVQESIPALEITGITDDSRAVNPGDLFVAVAGGTSDGHEFAASAVEAGAVAVLAEKEVPGVAAPVLVVPDLKRIRGELASTVFGHPSRNLNCVGVTGTNGKTSIACFIAELASRLGRPAGYMGTIGWGSPGNLSRSDLTTESAITIQRRLAGFRDAGSVWAVLEVSSHALDQHRVDGVSLRYGVFSNLSRDHLDYHGTFEHYGAAKARLFELPSLEAAVINSDDEFGRSLIERISGRLEIVTYGEGPTADVSWRELEFGPAGITGEFVTPWGEAEFELPLYGRFSVSNVAAALCVLCRAGFTLADVVTELSVISAVPGRMEFFPGQPTVVVDYAHTPDALEKMLTGLRPHSSGGLFCVCGCGGDRDRGKRPLMARAACEHADRVWFTSDNPRHEDPDRIIADMLAGVPGDAAVESLSDRRSAILAAFDAAGPDDLVVVAGKGHEDYQEVAGERLPFSDREIAAMLAADGGRAGLQRETGGSPCCSG
jgi:UDP-N-acetylmuramoyl-L-alanyl-D-glutamate--2,6-diaminopimelate ligase